MNKDNHFHLLLSILLWSLIAFCCNKLHGTWKRTGKKTNAYVKFLERKRRKILLEMWNVQKCFLNPGYRKIGGGGRRKEFL